MERERETKEGDRRGQGKRERDMGRKWGGEDKRRSMQEDVTAVHCGCFPSAMMSLATKRTPLHIFPLEILLSQLLGLRALAVTLH